MEKKLGTNGRIIDAAEYYRLSQNSELIRDLLCKVRRLLPPDLNNLRTLAKCIETHEYDDTLALLSVANELQRDDYISPEVWHLIKRHRCVGRLQGILNCACSLPKEGDALRIQLESLIIKKAKRLAYTQEAEFEPIPIVPVAVKEIWREGQTGNLSMA
jgi:hypothetical protein